MAHKRKLVDLNTLNINIENPRFEMVGSQRDAIKLMIEDQKEKLTRLAEDIIDEGLNPGDAIFITKHEKNKNEFNVLEGNRRVTVLKLLENPNLIPESKKSLLNKFKKLSENYLKSPIEKIPCVIFDTESDAEHWIELKHTGQNNGIGTVSWDAQQKARFDERVKGKSTYALQIIEFLGKEDSVEDDVKNNLKDVKSSSLQRLATDPDFRKAAGIDIKDGKVITKYDPIEIAKPLQKAVKDLLRKDFTVKDIYYKDDRLNYLETFKKSDLPDKTQELAGNWELISSNRPKKIDPKKEKDKKQKRSKKLKSNRNTIIPKSTILTISQPRINKIYHELKDLDLREFENAGAITFRVFIELTMDAYIEKFPITGVNDNSKLNHKLKSVAKDLESNHLTKHQLKGAYIAATMKDSVFSIDTFNAFVHNKDFNPDDKSLKKNWDNLEVFFDKIWELL